MKINKLSKTYNVRKLTENDIDIILEVCSKNLFFYEYHPPMSTPESIIKDMKALPPKKDVKDKFYVGFFGEEKLIAVMDLILDFPSEKIAYIGFFMMNMDDQGKGIGTEIITQVFDYLKEIGYKKVRLGIDKGNPQSERFWTKQGFEKVETESEYIPMEKMFAPKEI